MSIGELARRVGLRTSAIRYYESIGLLPPPTRVSGRRRYDADAIQRLSVVAAAQHAGLTLDEIRELLSADERGTVSRNVPSSKRKPRPHPGQRLRIASRALAGPINRADPKSG